MREWFQKYLLHLSIGVGFVALLLIVVPLTVNISAWWGLYRYGQSTGTIGDTIGGVTAPFIGLFTALLLYSSLRAQIEANRLQREALASQRVDSELQRQEQLQSARYQDLVDQLSDIHRSLVSLNYEGVYEDSEIRTGTLGLVAFKKDVQKASTMSNFAAELHYRSDMTRSLEWLLEAFRELLLEIDEADIDSQSKRALLVKARLTFRINLEVPLSSVLSRLSRLEGNQIFENLFREVQSRLGLVQWTPDFKFTRIKRTPGFPSQLEYDSDFEG